MKIYSLYFSKMHKKRSSTIRFVWHDLAVSSRVDKDSRWSEEWQLAIKGLNR